MDALLSAVPVALGFVHAAVFFCALWLVALLWARSDADAGNG